jgi:hypothetical protein
MVAPPVHTAPQRLHNPVGTAPSASQPPPSPAGPAAPSARGSWRNGRDNAAKNTPTHMAHGLGKPDAGIRDKEMQPTRQAFLEATQELTPEGLAFTVTHLQAEQLAAAISIDALGQDDGT